ncbi:hypothetical protein [Streptomyces diastatochromogenes]|uniref:Uncharacterized protein n=1 Tax=Streptomyces diastatochromogenes TaxID=42236 RepID=A0A233SCU1_STRDA|nr:hypothetical protein [Streptomyces diastatochromogenes]MCZ0990350.1 hypothetical protein [Streptomyces diastatochromogenes]OXY93463.1 hypothetical protein BEK98_22410 [Streptomyces diastatochromogenes]
MQKRFPAYGIGWSPNRRVAVIAIGLACLLSLAAATAFVTRRSDHPHTSAPVPSQTPSSTSQTGEPSSGTGPVARPPRISDPVEFAKAATKMLWSYDTRTTAQAQQLAGMKAWMTKESQYGDWASVSAQMPDPLLWSRMADQKQHAAATIAEGHYPAAFKQALSDDPSAITKAYIYAVTVTGKQTIAWKGGGGAEERSITLAVQCRPSADCTLVAIAPRVAP